MSKKRYSAVVEIGAALASSWKPAVKSVTGGLSAVQEELDGLKTKQKKLESFAPEDVEEAEKRYKELRGEARKLREEYGKATKPTKAMLRQVEAAERKAKKAAKAYGAQKKSLAKLSNELKESGIDVRAYRMEQKRLAKQIERSKKKMEAFKKVAKADIGGNARATGDALLQVGVGASAAAAGIGTAITMTNQMTAQTETLARSLNVSSETLTAWGGIAKEAGFETDNIGDLMEELNNKIGESKGLEEITPVTEALEILGLQFQDLEQLSPEEQFKAVASAVKSLDDQQAAVSAADILMGGEANKFFGFLRSRKEGVEELLDQQKQLNVLSDKGRSGALEYNQAFGRLTTVVGSATQEVSGLIGGALAPLVDEYGPKIAGWIEDNRSGFNGIGDTVREVMPGIIAAGKGIYSAVSSVGGAILWVTDLLGPTGTQVVLVGAVVGKLAFSIGGLGASLFQAGSALLPLIPGIGGVGAALSAAIVPAWGFATALLANPITWVVGGITAAVVAVGRLIYIWDDLVTSFKAGDGIIGGTMNAVGTFFGMGDDEEEAAASNPSKKEKGFFSSMNPFSDDEDEVQGVASANTPEVPAMRQSNTTTVHQNLGGITINGSSGQSVEELADEVMRRLEEKQHEANRGLMYDGV
ncbi:MAG: hypothetical protein ACNI27_08395 [Desulfovibrio sp.]